MNTWEVPVYLASTYNIKQIIYVPSGENQVQEEIRDFYIQRFRLNPDLTDWRFVEIKNVNKDYRLFQKERDERIINDAEIIFPVSLRPESTLFSRLKKSMAVINDNYRVEYLKPKHSLKIELNREIINEEIDKQLDGFIIHWTRTANNNWPGESLYDYYAAIINSNKEFPRSAYHTLIRILSEYRLRGSFRHYRKGVSAVAFSELKPSDAVRLMKWRARYREMTFEPYGIAIRKTTAKNIGLRQVIYGDKNRYISLSETDKTYFQSIGTKGYWVPEREWRYIGDLNMSMIDPDDLRIIVLNKSDIPKIQKLSESAVLSLYD